MPLSLKHLRTGHFEFSLMSLMILVVVISAQNGVSFFQFAANLAMKLTESGLWLSEHHGATRAILVSVALKIVAVFFQLAQKANACVFRPFP